MNFMYPGFLWAFAALLIPILIHLFNFKRYKTLYFSSLFFVKQVDEQTKSVQKLKNILVLISRLLAFSFLVLAFAQPYFSSGGGEKTKGNLLLLYVDNSFSMQAQGVNGELLSQARENAKLIVEKAPLETQFIIGTNEMTGIEERILNKSQALDKLDKIDFTPLQRSMEEIISWQSETLKSNQNDLTETQYVYFSDFQKQSDHQFTQDSGISEFSFFPIKLSAENTANLTIDSVWFDSPFHKINQNKTLQIRIQNWSDVTYENAEIELRIGEIQRTIFVNLPANTSTISQVTYKDKKDGFHSGSVSIRDKHIHFDDAFYFSYRVQSNTNVLILNGDDAVQNVAAVYQLDDHYTVQEKPFHSLTKNDLITPDLVVVNGENTLSRGFIDYLLEFHSSGGSLALFPGRNPDLTNWNTLVKSLNHSEIGAVLTSGNRVKSLNYDDFFFEGVFERKPTNLNLPSVSKIFRPIAQSNALDRPLITLQNGLSLLSRVQNKGNSFLFYSSLHPEFGNFTKDALFSTVLLRMGEISQRPQPAFMIIGDETRFPVYHIASEDNPIRLKKDNFEFIPATTKNGGITYLSVNLLGDFQNLRAGNYSIYGDEPLGDLSLNYNRNESDLTSYSEDEIQSKLATSGIKNIQFNEIGKETQLSAIDIEKPFSYWKICIVLSLIFVITEMLLIRLFN